MYATARWARLARRPRRKWLRISSPRSRNGSARRAEEERGRPNCGRAAQRKASAMYTDRTLAQSHDIATKVALLFRKRAEFAQAQYTSRLAQASEENVIGERATNPAAVGKV